jgi:enoyl-CoA hydratase
MDYTTLIVEQRGRAGLITLNRPQQLNALNDTLMDELSHALTAWDANPEIGAMVITGSAKAFAAGADIAAMKDLEFVDAYCAGFVTRNWETLRHIRKPVIAAVAGFALGGGCELAMMCDLLIAADNAKFGQPEIRLGVIPGAGGTQRLPLAIGKAKAMDLLLTARLMSAEEAERSGLVSRIVPAERLIEEALAAANRSASFLKP